MAEQQQLDQERAAQIEREERAVLALIESNIRLERMEKTLQEMSSLLVQISLYQVNGQQRSKTIDIDMPFGSMVGFMIKWAVAAIPAIIILAILGFAVFFVASTVLLVAL